MTSETNPGPADGHNLEDLARLTGEALPPEVQEASQHPDRRFGKYILFRELGRGGAGYVRKAWDTILGDYVALKFLNEEESVAGSTRGRVDAVRDLLQEARLAARLRHPHIVAIHDVGWLEKQFYIAMEFIQGETLLDAIATARKEGWPSPLYAEPNRILQLFLNIVEAIEYGHTFPTPIIHCDLKPSNILIARTGAAYVTDFGLARKVDPSKEEEIGIRGTPAYMAPEQVTGRASDLGIWTDVYGLGSLLYILLSGSPPLDGEPMEVLKQIGRKVPERPTRVLEHPACAERLRNHPILPHLPRLEEICMRCLAKRPEDRYQTAFRIASQIRPILDALNEASGEKPARARLSSDDMFHGLEPDLIDKTMADSSRHGQLIEDMRGRLAEKLNTIHPLVPDYPLANESEAEVRALKISGSRFYLLHRGEVEAATWNALTPDQIVALARAAKMEGADDRLALGLLMLRSGRGGKPEEPG